MLETRISDEDLEFMEALHDPVIFAECVFSDLESNDLTVFNDKNSEIRLYQYLFLSYEYYLDYTNQAHSKKKNFELRENAGSCYLLCARLIGKTVIGEQVDMLTGMMLLLNEQVGFTSFDHLHIKTVIEKVIMALEKHPIFKLLEAHIVRSPNYTIRLNSGYLLESVNQNLGSKSPGSSFHQKHFTRLYSEEASYESDEVYKKRAESVSEYGQVVRASGMTNFTRYSPIGRVFYSPEYRKHVINMPTMVSPMWDAKTKKKAIEKHNGEETASYRIFVLGEVVEDGLSVLDMDLVRRLCYMDDKVIKHFEINKDNFERFQSLIIVDEMRNASRVWLAADIGETAPTEIIVMFEIPNNSFSKYRYGYNITLYNLTDKQQTQIFQWLAQELKAHYIALDVTDGTGRAIYRSLEEVLGQEHLVWVGFNEKINVGFEKDEKGRVKLDSQFQPIPQEEFVAEWSIQWLKNLLYNSRLQLPLDYKMDNQFNSIVSTKSGNRIIYGTVSEADHLLAAFRCFAIAQWREEFAKSGPVKGKRDSVGVWV